MADEIKGYRTLIAGLSKHVKGLGTARIVRALRARGEADKTRARAEGGGG